MPSSMQFSKNALQDILLWAHKLWHTKLYQFLVLSWHKVQEDHRCPAVCSRPKIFNGPQDCFGHTNCSTYTKQYHLLVLSWHKMQADHSCRALANGLYDCFGNTSCCTLNGYTSAGKILLPSRTVFGHKPQENQQLPSCMPNKNALQDCFRQTKCSTLNRFPIAGSNNNTAQYCLVQESVHKKNSKKNSTHVQQ